MQDMIKLSYPPFHQAQDMIYLSYHFQQQSYLDFNPARQTHPESLKMLHQLG